MTRLIVVTLLLAVVAVVLKTRTKATKSSRTIKVTSRVTINRGAMVAVVEVDGRRLLVGASATQVNLLSELDEGEDIADGSSPLLGSPSSPTLASRLSGLRQRQTTMRSDIADSTFVATTPAPVPPTMASAVTTSRTAEASGGLMDKVRMMTTRTAEPKLRLPQRNGSAT